MKNQKTTNSGLNSKLLQFLRILGVVEGVSFLIILFVTMPLKYVWEMAEPNKIIGMAHGILFIAYCLLVVIVGYIFRWKLLTIFWALLASIIPFGTFVADKKIFKEEQNV
jgi:integral membrane protein